MDFLLHCLSVWEISCPGPFDLGNPWMGYLPSGSSESACSVLALCGREAFDFGSVADHPNAFFLQNRIDYLAEVASTGGLPLRNGRNDLLLPQWPLQSNARFVEVCNLLSDRRKPVLHHSSRLVQFGQFDGHKPQAHRADRN